MYLQYAIYVIGDVATVAEKVKDCLIAISGSGETRTVTIAAETASDSRASVISITTNKSSTLEILYVVINIESKLKEPWKHYTSHLL